MYYWGHIPQYFSLVLGTLCSELWYREDTCLLAHIPWDRLWNDWLNLPDHHSEEGVAVQRCYHNEQLCLPSTALSSDCIDKPWICRYYSSFSTGWKTSCQSIFKLPCAAAWDTQSITVGSGLEFPGCVCCCQWGGDSTDQIPGNEISREK